jgi:putative nucleotidyltransferase with HDIG domain
MVRPGEILRGLSRARRTAALYGTAHPVARQTLGEVHAAITEFLTDRHSVRFFMHEETFFAGKTVLLEESLRLPSLLADLREREIGMIELQEGIDLTELSRLVEILAASPEELRRHGGAAAALALHDVRHVRLAAVRAMSPDEEAGLRVDPRDVYRAGLRMIDDLHFQAARDLPLDMKKASLVVSSMIEVMADDKAALQGLAVLKHYDESALHHSVNVTILALLIGVQSRLERPQLMTLGLGALLHDIGKVRIPREILTKPAKLTDDELAIVRRHTLFGAHLLRNLAGPSRLAMIVAFEHHANFNLSGYPRLSMKSAPHPLSRIVQIAEFYDAATHSRRADHRPMLPAEAMTFVASRAGEIFDPDAAHVFVRAVGRYPVGSVVELDSGELAVVLRPSERDPSRPVVKVVQDLAGDPVPARTVHLDESTQVRVVRSIDPTETSIDVAVHLPSS